MIFTPALVVRVPEITETGSGEGGTGTATKIGRLMDQSTNKSQAGDFMLGCSMLGSGRAKQQPEETLRVAPETEVAETVQAG
jgi:hypothetical protein